MNCDEKQQETAAHALGALDPAAARALEQAAATDSSLQSEITRFRDVVAAFTQNAVPPRTPSPTVRGRVLDRIRKTPQIRPGTPASKPAFDPTKRPTPPPGFAFVHSDAGWQPTGVPGFQFRVLSINEREGYRVLLGKLEPGAQFPHHIHKTGAEELFLVSGDLFTAGRYMQAGDFVHADPGTDHPELYSPNGCIALLVEPIEGPEVLVHP